MSRLHAIKSYYDSDQGALVTLGDDVLGIVSQVNDLYDGKVAINLDPLTGWFHFTEHSDGVERLIFSVEELDGRALTRLQEADSTWHGHKDPYDALEREQDEEQARIDEAYREQLRDHGERLAHAIKADGNAPRMTTTVPVTRGKRANRS